jgi:hypothetical protein
MGISAGGGGGGGDTLFMKWNGIDTSQFEASPAFLPSGWSAPSLSVVADPLAPSGNVLRLQFTATAGAATIYWLLAATPPWEPEAISKDNRSFDYVQDLTIPSASVAVGPAYLCDVSGTFHGHAHCQNAINGVASRVDNGVETTGVTLGTKGEPQASLHEYKTHAGKQAGAPPTWLQVVKGASPSQELTIREDQTAVGGAPGATWNSLACDRIGIAVLASLAAGHTFDFRALSFALRKEAA